MDGARDAPEGLSRGFTRPAAVLAGAAAGPGPVFCHPESGRPLDSSKLIRRFKQALARADVHQITFHELRHTFGTRMAAAGVPLRTIQHWMGHADSKTTQIYAHYQPSEHEVELVERAFA